MALGLVDRDAPDPPSGNGGDGGGIERLIRLEERFRHLSNSVATKKDVESIKTLIAEKQLSSLRWTIGTSLVVALVIIGALKLL